MNITIKFTLKLKMKDDKEQIYCMDSHFKGNNLYVLYRLARVSMYKLNIFLNIFPNWATFLIDLQMDTHEQKQTITFHWSQSGDL
jgi:hypothetical protein